MDVRVAQKVFHWQTDNGSKPGSLSEPFNPEAQYRRQMGCKLGAKELHPRSAWMVIPAASYDGVTIAGRSLGS